MQKTIRVLSDLEIPRSLSTGVPVYNVFHFVISGITHHQNIHIYASIAFPAASASLLSLLLRTSQLYT
jgi:hypothetical protein